MLRVLLRFCNLFAVVFLVGGVGSLGPEGSASLAEIESRLLRVFNFGVSSSAAVLVSPTLAIFFLDDDDDGDDDGDDEDDDKDNSNESEDDVFIPPTLFSFFNNDFVVGVGLNFAGSLLLEFPISMMMMMMIMVDLGVYCVALRVVRLVFRGVRISFRNKALQLAGK